MLFYCYCGYLLQISKWLLEAEGYHRHLVNCTTGLGRWMALYNALREEWNQQILWPPQKIKYTRESSCAKFSIHFHGLPNNFCIIRSCSGAQPQMGLMAWAHCFVLWPLFRANLLFTAPRLTPSQALWTQQSPARSLSLGSCRLDLICPRNWTSTTSLWCNSKFSLSV